MYVCMCVYIYIYIYMYRPRPSPPRPCAGPSARASRCDDHNYDKFIAIANKHNNNCNHGTSCDNHNTTTNHSNHIIQILNNNKNQQVLLLALRGPHALATWRSLLGPADPGLARMTDPLSLNARFGGEGRSEAASLTKYYYYYYYSLYIIIIIIVIIIISSSSSPMYGARPSPWRRPRPPPGRASTW